jgi:DNA-3-methyladenine glycosylase
LLQKLDRTFFQKSATKVARGLIGTILVRRIGRKEFRARIVETEAYLGPADLASHSSKGRTKRTETMFGEAGRAYVYFIYGMYDMFNVVTGKTGHAHAVLIRAAEPLDGWQADLSGPGKLARAMQITRADNGLDITDGAITFWRDENERCRIHRTRRIGVDYAKQWRDTELRFFDAESRAVSRHPK